MFFFADGQVNTGRVWDYTRDRYVHHLPSVAEASTKESSVRACQVKAPASEGSCRPPVGDRA